MSMPSCVEEKIEERKGRFFVRRTQTLGFQSTADVLENPEKADRLKGMVCEGKVSGLLCYPSYYYDKLGFLRDDIDLTEEELLILTLPGESLPGIPAIDFLPCMSLPAKEIDGEKITLSEFVSPGLLSALSERSSVLA